MKGTMRATSFFLIMTALISSVPARAQVAAATGAFKVIELRRYTIKENERAHFAECFDTYFPEAMQQLGAIAAGDFLDRHNANMFTWIRGFHDMDERARANATFYYGPVWKEHKVQLNNMIVDSDNVLLLRPVSDQHPLLIVPAVDPIAEPNGAKGVVIALLFAVKPDRLDSFVTQAQAAVSQYSAAVREAGMFVTLNERNNFPQLPVREDGPYVFWIGVAKDDAALAAIEPVTARVKAALSSLDALRAEPETMVLDPSRRSRLRWLPDWH
jgi:NIPSNAP